MRENLKTGVGPERDDDNMKEIERVRINVFTALLLRVIFFKCCRKNKPLEEASLL